MDVLESQERQLQKCYSLRVRKCGRRKGVNGSGSQLANCLGILAIIYKDFVLPNNMDFYETLLASLN